MYIQGYVLQKKTVRIDHYKGQKSKWLVLRKELHSEYLKTADDISFYRFSVLQLCVPDTASKMHSVCVCQNYQNAQLVAAGKVDHYPTGEDSMSSRE